MQTLLLGGSDYVDRVRDLDLAAVRTAVICASDIFALEILRDLRARSLSVPRDVGLMGFDRIDALRYVTPALSTVEYPVQRMGELAFALLVEPPADGSTASVELAPRILWGESL